MQDDNAAPGDRLFKMVLQFWSARAIIATAHLGIADQIGETPRNIAEVAKDLEADAESLYRLMRGLAAVGVFREEDGRCFAHSPLSTLLRSDVPNSMRNLVRCFGFESVMGAMAHLEFTLKTGQSAFKRAFFDTMPEHPEETLAYNAAMASATASQARGILEGFDFSGVKKIADIGGGHGILLAEVLKKNPMQRGVLFDLPHVVAGAGSVLAEREVADRCEIRAGDFRQQLPQGCDGYVFKNILHGWSDEECVGLLIRAREAGAPGARIFVLERPIPQNNEPDVSKSFDLFMLLGGRHTRVRTEAEFAALFSAARFTLSRCVSTASGVFVIEGSQSHA